jgi:hypothetical protein
MKVDVQVHGMRINTNNVEDQLLILVLNKVISCWLSYKYKS